MVGSLIGLFFRCRQCLVFHNLNGITKAQKETLLKNNSMEQDESNTEVYHISWALFKHHKGLYMLKT
jgi:hypothetical protein